MPDTAYSGANEYRNVSFWFDSLPEPVVPAEPQEFEHNIDVAIVGAGFTGLWTAYYLKKSEPGLRIAIVEAEVAGFGASGRNGGWCMGESSEMFTQIEKNPERGIPLMRAMFDTVAEVGRVCDTQGIDCHYQRGGSLNVAHTSYHAEKLQKEIEWIHSLGFTDEDFKWLPIDAARKRVNMQVNHGAIHFAHVAALHPARLVRGLARLVRDMGVVIHELTPATAISPGLVETARGPLRAGKIVQATEAYTESLQGAQRKILPLYSMMVATEPLPEKVWDEIGLPNRETFGDCRRSVIYGQRTRDNRIAFGGRGGYDYESGRRRYISPGDTNVQRVETTLRDLFPVLKNYQITHGWGGVLGALRNWRPAVTFDRQTGLASAGGYVGEGVAASNLAARILCDLMLERQTALTQLPWVGEAPRRWEPEPLRWLGFHVGMKCADLADRKEFRTGRPARVMGAITEMLGF